MHVVCGKGRLGNGVLVLRAAVLCFILVPTAHAACEYEPYAKKQISSWNQWLGCQAPSLGDVCDRLVGPRIDLTSFSGRRVLLYSFDAGHLARKPDESVLRREFETLQTVREQFANTNMVVIGFTRGILLFAQGWLPQDILKKADFPIVNLSNKRGEDDLPEPYRLLKQPGMIAIDENGVIVHMSFGAADRASLEMAASAPSWSGKLRDPPLQGQSMDVPPGVPTEMVVVSRRVIGAGTVLTIQDLAKMKVGLTNEPTVYIYPSMVTGIVGRVLTRDLERGIPLKWDDVR